MNYLNGNRIDEKLRQRASVGGAFYFLQDHLGSAAALLDASGNVAERMQYEPYGESPDSASTRYGYTGRERDAAVKLMYYRARWYDPKHGRFVSEDPIGFSHNEMNLYRYVLNNPVRFTDPNGKNPLLAVAVFCALNPGLCSAVTEAVIGCMEGILDTESGPDASSIGIGLAASHDCSLILDFFENRRSCPVVPFVNSNPNFTVHVSGGTAKPMPGKK
jgi:RHS repeat-associated protein